MKPVQEACQRISLFISREPEIGLQECWKELSSNKPDLHRVALKNQTVALEAEWVTKKHSVKDLSFLLFLN